MFKIQSKNAPPYLQNACPPLTRDRTTYNLRSNMNITTPSQRTSTYQNSFFPQTIKDWNNLDQKYRQLPSIESFKNTLKNSSGQKTNKLYHHDSSKAAISHTRMRLGLSGLSAHRFNYNHINIPKCLTCAAKLEDPAHFFLLCPTYARHRPTLLRETCDILFLYGIQVDFLNKTFRDFFINTLLKGSPTFDLTTNKLIFQHVQSFIQTSQRFI
jgi:hypothetical protein